MSAYSVYTRVENSGVLDIVITGKNLKLLMRAMCFFLEAQVSYTIKDSVITVGILYWYILSI